MQISNYELIQMLNILKQFQDRRLPQQISYAISKNYRILEKEYDLYTEELNKIFKEYKFYFKTDEKKQVITNSNGLPEIMKESEKEKFYNEINQLLNIKVDIQPYYIEESLFNYDEQNGRYDCLPFNQIVLLQNVLCK